MRDRRSGSGSVVGKKEVMARSSLLELLPDCSGGEPSLISDTFRTAPKKALQQTYPCAAFLIQLKWHQPQKCSQTLSAAEAFL